MIRQAPRIFPRTSDTSEGDLLRNCHHSDLFILIKWRVSYHVFIYHSWLRYYINYFFFLTALYGPRPQATVCRPTARVAVPGRGQQPDGGSDRRWRSTWYAPRPSWVVKGMKRVSGQKGFKAVFDLCRNNLGPICIFVKRRFATPTNKSLDADNVECYTGHAVSNQARFCGEEWYGRWPSPRDILT